jgi:hypothetical protein
MAVGPFVAGGALLALALTLSLALLGLDIDRRVVLAVGLGLAGISLVVYSLRPGGQQQHPQR